MFSLIITVSAIALAIVITIATMMYGGSDTFQKGKDEAVAAQAVNELNQIRSALIAYQAQSGGFPTSLQELADKKYLNALPAGWGSGGGAPGLDEMELESRTLDADGERGEAICNLINQHLNNPTTPNCSANLPPNFMGCCISD